MKVLPLIHATQTPERAPATHSEQYTLIWLGGASCDGCTMATLGAVDPTLEDLLLSRVSDVPEVTLVHPALALESGDAYRATLEQAAEGRLDPFILILEGSVMDESRAGEGSFSRMGTIGDRPLTIASWIDRLARQATAVVAVGSCATWGGIPAAIGSPTGAMGLGKYLGPTYRSQSGLPVINVPGCAPPGEALVETVVYLLLHLTGLVPIELDDHQRPRWLYTEPAHPGPPRTNDMPLTIYTSEDRPVVQCPVPTQGWMRGIGGCARVGGACIGCTAPDFPDRHLKFASPGRRRTASVLQKPSD